METEPLIGFLKELQFNNNKVWFDEHRARYETLRKTFQADIQQIIDSFGEYDPILRGLKPADCMFRINKRFPDSAGPYKTTFSANFSSGKRGGYFPGYYFEINEDGVISLGGGLYMPSPEQLMQIREDIAQNSTRIQQVLESRVLRQVYTGLEDMRAAKVPKGYPADHPQAELLKQKGFVVFKSADTRETQAEGLPTYVTRHFKATYPLVEYLRRFGM